MSRPWRKSRDGPCRFGGRRRFALQFFNQWGATAATEETGGVAYGAHIGGFLAGMALALVLRMTGTRERPGRLAAGGRMFGG